MNLGNEDGPSSPTGFYLDRRRIEALRPRGSAVTVRGRAELDWGYLESTFDRLRPP